MPKRTTSKKKKLKPFDSFFFLLIMVLLAFGMVMLFSASAPTATQEPFNNPFYFVFRQAIWAAIGVAGMIVISRIDYRFWRRFSRLGLVAALVLLLLVLLVGQEINGAKRWLGFGSFSFQPSEFAKIAVILFFADALTRTGEKLKKFWRGLLPYLLLLGVFAVLLLLEPHLSGTVVIAGTACIMLLLAGARVWHFALLAGGVSPLAVWLITSSEYRLTRVISFVDPWQYKLEGGWQIIQSLYAIGSGGLFGLGLTQSRQKFLYIPEPYNDFIFAIVCEELGFFGAAAVLLLFALLIIRGTKIALNAPDTFGTLLVGGVVSLIAIQVFINIAVVTSSVPVTGMPLPFFSYGGSSLSFILCAMGLVLNVSRQSKGVLKS